jgi:hypothetical protein
MRGIQRSITGRHGGFVGFARLFGRLIFPALDSYVHGLAVSIRGVDLLLAHPALVAAPIAAEHAGVGWGHDQRVSGAHATAYAPPSPTRVSLGSGRFGRAIHEAAWRAARFNMAPLLDRPVNQARRRLGLAPVSNSFFTPVDAGRPYLVMASPAVIDQPADWPQNMTLTGVVAWDRVSSFPAPDGPEEFLTAGDPPVLVTLGASSSLDARHFYRHAADGVTGLGHRALVLAARVGRRRDAPSPAARWSDTGSGCRPPSACPGHARPCWRWRHPSRVTPARRHVAPGSKVPTVSEPQPRIRSGRRIAT